ncbi:hypothetical protein FHT77_005528 [Rhizobium sp. BK181]|nr:hypothetical protein [Rhizobium sp. BK181]
MAMVVDGRTVFSLVLLVPRPMNFRDLSAGMGSHRKELMACIGAGGTFKSGHLQSLGAARLLERLPFDVVRLLPTEEEVL